MFQNELEVEWLKSSEKELFELFLFFNLNLIIKQIYKYFSPSTFTLPILIKHKNKKKEEENIFTGCMDVWQKVCYNGVPISPASKTHVPAKRFLNRLIAWLIF